MTGDFNKIMNRENTKFINRSYIIFTFFTHSKSAYFKLAIILSRVLRSNKHGRSNVSSIIPGLGRLTQIRSDQTGHCTLPCLSSF